MKKVYPYIPASGVNDNSMERLALYQGRHGHAVCGLGMQLSGHIIFIGGREL
jgi:hypothetical protein